MNDSQEGGAKSGALETQNPELSEVVRAWPKLSAAVRCGILAMVRTAE
jgi:hypothetical protein